MLNNVALKKNYELVVEDVGAGRKYVITQAIRIVDVNCF